ncbi:glycosyltransferase family 4 protein, partial [Streptococcus thermophilus]
STMKRLTRMVTHLPTKAITLPVNGSVRIIKGSAKQVKKIRNIKKFLD